MNVYERCNRGEKKPKQKIELKKKKPKGKLKM
jgi:hypothetical protein